MDDKWIAYIKEDVVIPDVVRDKMNQSYERIHKLAKQEKPVISPRSIRKKISAAAMFLLVCTVTLGTVAYAATDGEIFQHILSFLSGGATYRVTEIKQGGEENTTAVTIVKSDGELEKSNAEGYPLLLEGDRLYFTASGEKMDITDNISESEPYIIDVMDQEGNLHRFIIGGRAEKDYYGYHEMLFDSQGNFRGGVGSLGSKVDGGETGVEPEWLKRGQETIYKSIMESQ